LAVPKKRVVGGDKMSIPIAAKRKLERERERERERTAVTKKYESAPFLFLFPVDPEMCALGALNSRLQWHRGKRTKKNFGNCSVSRKAGGGKIVWLSSSPFPRL
jgi:hypothetical protein